MTDYNFSYKQTDTLRDHVTLVPREDINRPYTLYTMMSNQVASPNNLTMLTVHCRVCIIYILHTYLDETFTRKGCVEVTFVPFQ